MKRTLNIIMFGIMALTALSSCNTIIGLGRDMRVLGTEMEKRAGKGAGVTNSEDNYDVAPVY